MKRITEKIVQILGTKYTVINAWNQSEQIDLNGVIAINAGSKTPLNHGNSKDFSVTINVAGQILCQDDITQQKTNEMFSFVFDTIENTNFTEVFEDCAGSAILSSELIPDGETNTFTVTFELYFCKD